MDYLCSTSLFSYWLDSFFPGTKIKDTVIYADFVQYHINPFTSTWLSAAILAVHTAWPPSFLTTCFKWISKILWYRKCFNWLITTQFVLKIKWSCGKKWNYSSLSTWSSPWFLQRSHEFTVQLPFHHKIAGLVQERYLFLWKNLKIHHRHVHFHLQWFTELANQLLRRVRARE